LLGIINDILDLSKIEAERMVLEAVPLQLAEIVGHLNDSLGPKAAEKGLRLTTDLPADLAHLPLKGDPLRLGQILFNLVGNAIKFTGQGEVTLRVRAAGETAEGVQVRFEVSDTGIGIEPEAQSRLFQSFEQADNSMTRKYGGSGLGLAISKRLVRLMGGEIGVDSKPEQGSTFWFVIPLKKREQAAVAPAPTISAHSISAHSISTHSALLKWPPASVPEVSDGTTADPAEAEAEAALRARLTTIPDLDFDAGLRLMRGKLPSYQHILTLFAERQGDNLQRLTYLINQNDLDTAEQLAHAIKGAAGNVGALPIHALATTLDDALKRGDGAAAQAALTPLAEHLPRLIEALQTALAKPAQQQTVAAAAPTAEQNRIVGELLALLDAGDIRARHLLAAQRASIEATLGSTRHAAVEQAVRHFDYSEAVRLLKASA
jgi:HPt (histidine-containing phosphotransfer) domain-containing protein/two-component sensor histidine kinase